MNIARRSRRRAKALRQSALKRRSIMYVDCGKTNCRIGIIDTNGLPIQQMLNYDVTKFNSVEQILEDAFRQFGSIPRRIVFALPGPIDRQNRTVKLLDLDWPMFDLGKFEQATGCKGILVNDLQLQAAGCQYNLKNHRNRKPPKRFRRVRARNRRHTNAFEHFRLVKPGNDSHADWQAGVWLDGRVVVATLTTGDNISGYDGWGFPWAFEAGHINIVGTTDDEKSYCEFSARFHNEEGGRAERLIGGARAFRTAVAWLRSMGETPGAEAAAAIAALEGAGKGVGPAITAHPDDPFCARIIRVLGGLMANWLRAIMEFMQPDALLILVGTIMVLAGHLFVDPKRSPFVERLPQSIPYPERLNEFTVVRCVDPDLARKGACVIARRVK